MSLDLLGIPALVHYDSAIDWPARLAREGPFLLGALAGAPSRRAVDLGCGTGEHARWLAAQGWSVVGIEGVKERWEVANGLATANVEYLLGDLGAVEAMVRGQFGAALCLGNTLPALIGAEAVSRLLIGLRRRFLSGGIFVLHQWNYDGLERRAVGALPQRRLVQSDGELVFESALGYEQDGVVAVRERISWRELGAESAGRLLHERQRHLQGWRHAELLTLLDLARFRRVAVYGGFGGEPFDLDLSDELVLVAS